MQKQLKKTEGIMTRQILDRILKLLDAEKDATGGEKLAALRSALEIVTQESLMVDDRSIRLHRAFRRRLQEHPNTNPGFDPGEANGVDDQN